MKTIETLTRIRDHIRNVILPTAQGKTDGKWEAHDNRVALWWGDECHGGDWIDGDAMTNRDASFIAATSDTAEPAWLDTAEEIDELLPILNTDDGSDLGRYATSRADSIINNWKEVIK